MIDEMKAVIMLLMLGAPATLYLLSPRKGIPNTDVYITVHCRTLVHSD